MFNAGVYNSTLYNANGLVGEIKYSNDIPSGELRTDKARSSVKRQIVSMELK